MVLSQKLHRMEFLWLRHVWQWFSCILLHQARSMLSSAFFLSKNVINVFFESTIYILFPWMAIVSEGSKINEMHWLLRFLC